MSDGLDRGEVQDIVNNILPKMELLVDKKIEKLESTRNDGIGCQSPLGCIAGKRHFQWHKDKLNSDIEDFIGFKAEQEKENREMGGKLSSIAGHMEVVAINMSNISESFVDIKKEFKEHKIGIKKDIEKEWVAKEKRIDIYEGRFWWMVGILVGASLTAVWRIDAAVSKGLLIEKESRRSAETFFALTVAEITNQTVDEVIKKHGKFFMPSEKINIEIEKEKK